LADATYVTPSVDPAIFVQGLVSSVAVSTGQISPVARFPTYANPSPMETALGPTVRFDP
jgi:hypothetical protein